MLVRKFAAAALLMTVAMIGWSQTSPEDHAGHHPPETPQASAPSAMPDRKMMESKDDLAPIRGLIERAERAKTAAERERLLDEHLAAMRKQLDSFKSRECAMEKADGAKPGMMGEGMKMDDGMKNDQMMMCHQMMKARMETMVELLEQTWRREELRKNVAR